MKKLNLMLLAVAFVISGVATASTGIGNESSSSDVGLTKEIGELLKKPSFEVANELEAFVTFTLNEKNEIVVLSVDSDSEVIESFIKSRLNYKKVAMKEKSAVKFYKIPVRLIGE